MLWFHGSYRDVIDDVLISLLMLLFFVGDLIVVMCLLLSRFWLWSWWRRWWGLRRPWRLARSRLPDRPTGQSLYTASHWMPTWQQLCWEVACGRSHRDFSVGTVQRLKMGSCGLKRGFPHQWIWLAQRQASHVSVNYDRVGCHVMCHSRLCNHIGQSTTATSRHRHDIWPQMFKSDVKPRQTIAKLPQMCKPNKALTINKSTTLPKYDRRSACPTRPSTMMVSQHSTLDPPYSAPFIWMGNPECGQCFLIVECRVSIIS